MLHELLKQSTSKVPQFNPQTPAVQPITPPTVMDLSALDCTFVMEPSDDPVLPATPSPSKNSPEPSTSTTPTLAVNNQIVAPSSSSTQIFEEVFKRSSSMPNYAKNLVFELFRQDELVNKNCAGMKGKQAIGNDPRMDSVREQTFKRYRVTDRNAAWALCRKAIDTALRKMRLPL